MTSVLRYPLEAVTASTDYLQVTIKAYDSVSGISTLITGNAVNAATTNVSATTSAQLSTASLAENGIILLPMPSNIQDGNSVSYGDDTINGYAAAAVAPISDILNNSGKSEPGISNDLKALVGKTSMLLDKFITDPEARKAMNRYFAAQALNTIGGNITPDQLLARESGRIFNPNMELLFNGVTLRSFKFSFKMTPRDPQEARQVRLILRTLKKNMAPKTQTDNANFLKTPNVFELAYRKGNKDHPFLHRFKPCALTDMSVNYTGENVYAVYSDGVPVSTILDLTFKELVPIYDVDYDQFDDSDEEKYSVGY